MSLSVKHLHESSVSRYLLNICMGVVCRYLLNIFM